MTKEELKAVIELFNEIESKCDVIDKNVWIGFQLGSQVRIKKEYQQSTNDARLFYIVCYSEYINGDKWYNLAIDKDITNCIPLMYKDNQIELV